MAIKNGDKKKVSKKTEQQLQQILEYMTPDQEYKTSELAEVIGIKASRARVLVNELVKSGKIRASGKNKGRRYKRI
ncbi:FaeA/PapI family transcriptional regulator [Zhenpiania hominis]|uniref:FaeA/PapI family transcriptional regulator n=1 Tax=Zhenpiania hominis TaxID=2763644 RepID=UPI0039F6121E